MQVPKICRPVKRPAVPARSATQPQSQSGSRDVNSALLQRALDMVHDGQLTAGVAIKMFGIPRSTFYKKLSMCKQQPEPDGQSEQYYQTDSDFGTDDFSAVVDSFGQSTGNTHARMSVGQLSSYSDYYAT